MEKMAIASRRDGVQLLQISRRLSLIVLLACPAEADGSLLTVRLRPSGFGGTAFACERLDYGCWLAQPKLTGSDRTARLRAKRFGGAAFACIRERRLASPTGFE